MFNKYAEYEKRRRTYLACRGVLRIKQADTLSDAVAAANDNGDRLADIYNKNLWYDRMARAAGIAGGRAGHHVGTDLRAAGSEAAKGFDAMGRDIGGAFEHNGGSIEGFGERIGDYLGKGVRGAGEGIRQGANYLANGAYEVGRGALGGLRNAGAGLVSGLDHIGTGMSNGMDNWLTDMVQHPGAHGVGLGLGAGLGLGGYHVGNALANKLGLDNKGWGARALRWGLAGLGGLGGYWAGTGIGKGFGKHFARGKAPVNREDEFPFKPKPKPGFGAVVQDEDMNEPPDDLYGGKGYASYHAPKPPEYKYKLDYFSPDIQKALIAAKIHPKNINKDQALRLRNGETLEQVFGNKAGFKPSVTGFKGNTKTSNYYRVLLALNKLLQRYNG